MLESVPPYKFHFILPQSRVPISCQSANSETEGYQVSGSLVKIVWSVSSLIMKPLKDTSSLSKKAGNNDDDNLP